MTALFHADASGRMVLTATNTKDGSAITVVQQGAHLTSWRDKDGEEHLYTSPKAIYADGKAIRGGVPLIFPQFSDLGNIPVSHGFLRVAPQWQASQSVQDGGLHRLTLTYECTPNMEKHFPNAHCLLNYIISFTATELSLGISVTNAHATEPLTFSFTFHSYFGVADVHEVKVSGLDDTTYLNNLQARKQCPPSKLHDIRGEIDRIYLNQGSKPVVLHTTSAKKTPKQLTIAAKTFKDAVFWNPWIEKTKSMSDMPADGYLHFVCVEHGTIVDKEAIKPGETWTAAQTVSVAYS